MTEAQPRQVEIYVAPNGKVPFKEWLNALRDLRARTKIDARIARLQLGNLGDVKSIGEGVQELRIDDGPGRVSRLLWSSWYNTHSATVCG